MRDMALLRAAHQERMATLKAERLNRADAELKKKKAWDLEWEQKTKNLPSMDMLVNAQRASVRAQIRKHQKALQMGYLQLVQKDEFGVVSLAKWHDKRRYFFENVLYPSLGGQKACRLELAELIRLVDTAAAKPLPGLTDMLAIEDMSGVDFERYCAGCLERYGWDVQITKASGDQGVDILAKRGRVVLALQCKKYAKPVGNSAVQEVSAGMRFYGASHGAVVSNAGYTPAAKKLAITNGIHLLHHTQLIDLEGLVKRS